MPPSDASSSAPSSADAGASRTNVWSGIDAGTIMGTELVVGILLWTGIGHLVDRWLGTDPWFLVIGGLVGFAGGLYLVFLRSGRMEAAERARRGDSDEG